MGGPTDVAPAGAPLDPVAGLLVPLGTAAGALLAVVVRRRRGAPLDPAVARRLAALAADPVGELGGREPRYLDAARATRLSSRPTGAGEARSR